MADKLVHLHPAGQVALHQPRHAVTTLPALRQEGRGREGRGGRGGEGRGGEGRGGEGGEGRGGEGRGGEGGEGRGGEGGADGRMPLSKHHL